MKGLVSVVCFIFATMQFAEAGWIKGKSSGKCMAIAASSQDNGGDNVLWNCANDGNFDWTYHPTWTPLGFGGFTVVVKHSGKCLTNHGDIDANNNIVDQWDCIYNAPNQFWKFRHVDDWFQLVNPKTNKCLTTNTNTNGVKLTIYDCVNGAENQLWQFVRQ